jgi:hypothetical protein
MNTQYIQLLQIIESFASEHKEIRRFKADFLEQLQNFGTDGESYPILYVVPNASSFNINTYNDMNTFTLNIYCVDLINEDRSNVNTILNTTNLVLNDLHLFFKEAEIAGIDLINTSNLTPLNNYMLDVTTGWFVTMTFEVQSHSVCEIPFNNAPIIPTGECDIIYSRWATEEEIADLQEQIDNIVITGGSGTSGTSGVNGTSGINGTNGLNGTSGINGVNGTSGSSGYSGLNGTSGSSGLNGVNGTSGSSGYSGLNGTSGTSGVNGIDASGTSGTSGISGTSGVSPTFTTAVYTIELMDIQVVTFYAPQDLKINSTTNIKNAPTITIKDDGVSYTLTNTIASGSAVEVTASIAGVTNLNVEFV